MNSNVNSNKIQFLGSPAKYGKSYAFTIPNVLIKANMVDPNMIYNITIIPVKVKPSKKKK